MRKIHLSKVFWVKKIDYRRYWDYDLGHFVSILRKLVKKIINVKYVHVNQFQIPLLVISSLMICFNAIEVNGSFITFFKLWLSVKGTRILAATVFS